MQEGRKGAEEPDMEKPAAGRSRVSPSRCLEGGFCGGVPELFHGLGFEGQRWCWLGHCLNVVLAL